MSAKAKNAPSLPKISKDAKSEDVVTINFLEDGMTAFGVVWYRGQEVSVEKGSPEWESTLDEDGNSWLEWDEDEQLERWGVRFHKAGKWSGKGFDLNDPELSPADKAALLAAAGAAPAPKKTPAAKRGPGRPPKIG
jgi:hypothetical protein